ncbi:MAG: GNAT family N-acetyltransferase [Methanomassiliicoccales archaeon]
MLVVRKARRSDLEKIFQMICELADFEKLNRPDRSGMKRFEKDLFERRRINAFIAFLEGEPAGYAIYFNTYSTFLLRPTLYLEDIFVRVVFRNGGVGKALMKRLAKEALKSGCGRMEWLVLGWNKGAIEFYRKLGAIQLADWKFFRLERDGMERLASAE